MLGRGLTAILVASLLIPAGAAAQSNRPDPDSPAGVEYELPLDQTRKDLSDDGDGPRRGGGENGSDPGASGGGGAESAAPLFGAGISREGASAGGEAPGDGSSGGDRADSGDGAGSPPDGEASDDSGPAVSRASTGDEGSTGLLLPGLALLVILAGGAMGLLLRRGLGSSGS
jgi:hypothetical protein